jgi:hypothetical protein
MRWPPGCERVRPGAEKLPRLSQLRVAVVRTEWLMVEAEECNPKERERPSLIAATKQRLLKTENTLCMLSLSNKFS